MNIIVFGDSISFGQYVSPHNTWVGKLSVAVELLSTELNSDLLLQCEAVNGRTTRMALETISQEVQKHRPDIVVVQFGLNDCNYWDSDEGLPRVSLNSFGGNIAEIITRCLNFGAKKVFVNTNHPTTRQSPITTKPELTYQQSNQTYSQKIREEVEGYNDDRVSLIDIEKSVMTRVNNNEATIADFILPPPDALHLSLFGHQHYYNEVGETILLEIRQQLGKT